MSDPRETDAFVLRTVEYGDRDLIVHLFGRSTGKLSAIAKNARGSKRRFGGGLQPMRLLTIDFTAKPNRDLAFLNGISVLEDFPEIEADYDKIAAGSYATDLLRNVTVEADPSSELFDLTVQWFEQLAESDPATGFLEILLRHYQMRVLGFVGSLPALDHCFRCGANSETMTKVRALRSGEGVVCANCRRTGEPIGVLYPETADVWQYLRRPGAEAPEALEDPRYLTQAGRLVDAALERLLDRPLKSRSMLDSVLHTPH